ncbi:hypothetical protein CRG98_002836 [Punica granatum]|uniref:Transposase MuDR plant domain-containing protein n=1 Tax=Punica granatum TaxID=22663 RepID=A0A2I0L888_PUNGR|nr:hypothetical protein CRG98_002836 [Punica granatum]
MEVTDDHGVQMQSDPEHPKGPPSNAPVHIEAEEDKLYDGYASIDLESLRDEDEEGDYHFPVLNENREIVIGMEFEKLHVFKNAVRDLNISWGKEVQFEKNDKVRVRAHCVKKDKEEGCLSKIYYALNNKLNIFQVAPETHHFHRQYIYLEIFVEMECKDSRKWFLKNLIADVGDPVEKKYTFISNMQKMIKGMKLV